MRQEKSPPWKGRLEGLRCSVVSRTTALPVVTTPVAMAMAVVAAVMAAVVAVTAVMTAVITMAVVTLVHGALDDATEDTAKDTAHEGFSSGGASGSLLNDNRLAVGHRNDLRGGRSDGLNARDTGDVKAGHVNGCLVDEGAGLTGEAVVIEGGGFGCGAGDDEGGTGEGSSGHTREGVAQERGGGHGRRL